MHSSRRSPPRVARCRAAHRPNGPSIPLAQPCRIEHETALFGRAVKRYALRLLGWAAVPIGPCARTCTRQHTDAARAQLRVARALSAAAAAAAGMLLLLLLLLLLHPSPLEDPNLQGPHQNHAGARTPSCPRSCAAALHATSECARSQLPALGQTICGFLSEARAGNAQTAANHRQQAKG